MLKKSSSYLIHTYELNISHAQRQYILAVVDIRQTYEFFLGPLVLRFTHKVRIEILCETSTDLHPYNLDDVV